MKKIVSLIFVLVFCVLIICGCAGRNNEITDSKVTDFYVDKTAESEKETKEEIKNPVVEQVSFAAAGDNIIYQSNLTDARNRANEQYPEYNFTPVYSDILPKIQAADFAFINQETLMAGEKYGYSDYPCFNSPQTLGDQLCDMGFDIISIANNHMLDMGSSGISDTIAYWKSKSDVTMIGGYSDETDYNTARIVERNGIKIGLLAYTYATNGIKLSSSSSVVIPYISEERIKADIERVKKVCDTVVVSVHWGVENSFEASDEQKSIAQLMCDLGVSVIIGHHPHVIQSVEWLHNSSGGTTLCIYSLGDFVATMAKGYNMLGGICTFDIIKTDGKITVDNVLFEPVVNHFGPSYYNSHIYYLSDFTPELAATFGNVYGIKDNYEELCAYVKNTIASEFLPEYLK